MNFDNYKEKIFNFLSVFSKNKIVRNIFLAIFCFLFILLTMNSFVWSAPSHFPLTSIYTVKNGDGLSITAEQLEQENIIKSPFWFKSFLVIFSGPRGLMAGDYVMSKNQSVFILAYRLSHGDYGLDPIKVTIPEGKNLFEISELLVKIFSQINNEDFITQAQALEGYLFPDTYYFLPNVDERTVLDTMTKNFASKISTLSEEINNFNESLSDIIKMASIIEEESNTYDDSRIISGILWKRLALGMPLQVDASFKYINGKVTADLTLEDLKTESPYNSYLYKGLPPTPISNPGLNSIMAAIEPTETEYLYFLSDDDGKMHYAETYKVHLQNKKLYL